MPSWTAGTLLLITGDWPLHYSGAPRRIYTFVFSEVALHSVGCKHEKVFYFYSIIALNRVLFTGSFVLWYLGMAVYSSYENLDQSNLKPQCFPPSPTTQPVQG